MKRRHVVLVSIITASLVISLIAFLFINKSTSASPPQTLPQCNEITNNGQNTVNMVFLSNKETAEEYANYFLSVSPYKENQDKFSLYYVDEEPECELYRGIATLCHNKETIKKAAACPNDYVIAIKDYPSAIRSSAFSTTLSINGVSPLTVLIHELGHVLGDFAEEYETDAKIPFRSENCISSCPFPSDSDGCYQECTDSSHYRSIENGVMRTLSTPEYGLFNQEILIRKINEKINKKTSLITGFAIEDNENCQNQEYLLVEGKYENGEIQVFSKQKFPGCANSGTDNGRLTYQTISEAGEISSDGTIQEEYIFIDDDTTQNPELNGLITETPAQNNQNFIIILPDMEQTNDLQILNEDGEIIYQDNLNDIGARPCLLQ